MISPVARAIFAPKLGRSSNVVDTGDNGDAAMTYKFLKCGALVAALGLTLAGCTPNAPSNAYQAQYLSDLRPCQPGTHSQSAPSGQGYRCVLNQ
jgi:hypothetical protein